MQLTYRGINYTPSTEISAPKTAQLIYRGVAFERTFNRVTPVRQAACDTENAVKFIYRGLTYNCTPTPVTPYQQPRALNWRYQVA